MNVYNGYKKIKKEVAYRIALHLQSESHKKAPYYEEIIGKGVFKEIGKKANVMSMNEVKIIDGPSMKQKEALMAQMNMGLQQQLLKPSDIYRITALMDEGKPLSIIAMILNDKEEKAAKQQSDNAQAAQQANDQKQSQMQEQKLQFEGAKVQAKTQSDSQLSNQEFEQDRMLQNEEYQWKDINAEKDDVREMRVFGEPKRNNTDSRAS
jgi:hypothetical protein